jgi:hypothetical protein
VVNDTLQFRIPILWYDNAEVRLKNYGADAIEVIDNGSGVEECNFEALSEFLVFFSPQQWYRIGIMRILSCLCFLV